MQCLESAERYRYGGISNPPSEEEIGEDRNEILKQNKIFRTAENGTVAVVAA